MKPKILFIDIETTPNLSYNWGKYEQNAVGFEKHSHLLSFSAKWKGGKRITKGLIDYPGYKKNKESDIYLVQEIRDLLDECDIAVAHNGDQFDFKKINARLVDHMLTLPSPYKTVDTKKVAKRNFMFTSNSLDDIAQYLRIGQKLQTGGFELWLGCMAGDKKAWDKMKRYNAYDVKLLEEVYDRMLPYMNNHPNQGMFHGKEVCPRCGKSEMQSRGYALTLTGKFRRFQCQYCSAWSRSGKPEEKFKTLRNV